MLMSTVFYNCAKHFAWQNRTCLNLVNVASRRLQFYSGKPLKPVVVEGISDTVLPTKGKRPVVPKITLLSGDDVSVTTLEDAQKLSKRRDLKLVKIVDLDTKTQRPVYKLMTAAAYHSEDLKRRKDKQNNGSLKKDKVLMLNAVISTHDMETQVKKILKWLQKQHEVKVVISGDLDKSEKVYKFFEDSLKNDARFLQKRTKGTDLKFQLIPPKNKNEDKENQSSSSPS